jgi:hypothetical protein
MSLRERTHSGLGIIEPKKTERHSALAAHHKPTNNDLPPPK